MGVPTGQSIMFYYGKPRKKFKDGVVSKLERSTFARYKTENKGKNRVSIKFR
jgi:hypothetical protein